MVEKLTQLSRVLDIKNIPGDYDQRTAMHLACAGGHEDIIKLLISEGCDVNVLDRFGRTPLYEACLNRHDGCVNLLRPEGKLQLQDAGGELCRVQSPRFPQPKALEPFSHMNRSKQNCK